MDGTESLILPIAIAVFAASILIVLTPYLLRGNRGHGGPRRTQITCSVCHNELQVHAEDLERITGSDVALIAREYPAAQGRPLGHLRCTKCGAYHVFALDSRPPSFLVTEPFEGIDLYNCSQCHKALAKPSWPKGQYDNRINEAPGLSPQHGLYCARCKSIVCVQCCREATRGRTKDGSLLCPRCFRGPVTQFHHF